MSSLQKITKWVSLLGAQHLSCLGKRDENCCVFGAWWGERFADNPKYLYLYCVEKGYDALWLTRSDAVYRQLTEQHLPVAYIDSREGIAASKRAKFAFYCTSTFDINPNYIGNAVIINLWHGIPLKKVAYDDSYISASAARNREIADRLQKIPLRKEYVVSTSPAISAIYRSAFRKDDSHILQLGQPRNDAFFNGMLKKRSYKDIPYSKMVAYLPTHRNEGKTKIDIPEIFDLPALDAYCRENDILFVIKKHFYHRDECTDLTAFSNIVDLTTQAVDTQELLYNADILITDYSSCYIDYLLLDRPILFYAYDYDNYILHDREMYFQYEDVTPGEKIADFGSLLGAMKHAIASPEEWAQRNKPIKDLFYAPECQGQVCENILREIRNIK